MTCDNARALLSAFVDRELDVTTSVAVEGHVAGCARCAAGVSELDGLRSALHGAALAYPVPAGLQRRIGKAIRAEARATAPARFAWWRWAAMPAAAAVAAVLAWNVALQRGMPSADQRLAAELVSGHVRSLMADHLVDVATSDQHTVKPWFNGKVDFAPPVADFAAQGFPLVGGRVDYIGGRPVAVLIYQRRQHVVNVFIWPASAAAAAAELQARSMEGYHLLEWTQSGLTFWAVSDAGAADLESLARLIGDEAGPR